LKPWARRNPFAGPPPWLYYAVLATALLSVLASATIVWQVRATDYEARSRAALNTARLAADDVDESFNRLNALLSSIGRQYVDGVESAPKQDPVLAQSIGEEIAAYPFGGSIFVVDSTGRLALGSVAFDHRQDGGDVSDQPYFKRAVAGELGPIYEGPFRAKPTGDWTIAVARRLVDRNGKFFGAAVASIPVEVFEKRLARIDLADHGVIVLRNANGEQVTRYSRDARERAAPGDATISQTLRSLLSERLDHAFYEAVSPIDRVGRLYAFQRLHDAPFFFLVGEPTADLEQSARRLALELGLLCVSVTIAALWISRRLHRAATLLSEERLAYDERLKALLDASVDGVYIHDLDGDIVEFSPSFASMLGYGRAEAARLNVSDFEAVKTASQLREAFQTEAQGGGANVIETRHRRKDGSVFDVEISVKAVAVGGNTYLHSSSRDISERMRIRRALERAKLQAESANKAKSEFLANISHEIRTPLNAILGMSQVLARSGLNDDQLDCVERLDSAGQNMLALLSEVLDLSKIEAGQLILNEAPFSLAEVIAGSVNTLSVSANAKGLTLFVEPLPEDLPTLIGDSVRLSQVVSNLVGNAVKFTLRGGMTLSVQALERAAETVRVRVTVRDTGIGIAEEHIGKLFEPFVQAEQTTYRRFGGTGLGLTISKRLVSLMGGEIGVESKPGAGSAFWFVIPFETTSTKVIGQTRAASSRRDKQLRGARILVVDDTETNREIAIRLLSLEGAVCEAAEDGEAAIERLRAGPSDFDLVLMDVQMPAMDGLQATRIIRHDLGCTTLPVIALTAGAMPSQRELAFAAGMNGFVAKPFRLSELVAALSPWIRPVPAAAADPSVEREQPRAANAAR
jgi:PAS domain S-box-containing protein